MITNSTITEHNALQAFRSKILSKLLSEPAYDHIAKINTSIRLPPSENYPTDRDFTALSNDLRSVGEVGAVPFESELHRQGNKYADSIFQHYSRCCCNLRSKMDKLCLVLHKIDGKYQYNFQLHPLFLSLFKELLSNHTVICTLKRDNDFKAEALRLDEVVKSRDSLFSSLPYYEKIHSRYKPENESQIIAPSYSPPGCSKTYHGGSAMSVGVYHEFINNFLKPTELSPYMERRLLAICREFLSIVNVDRIAPDY